MIFKESTKFEVILFFPPCLWGIMEFLEDFYLITRNLSIYIYE